MARKRRSYTLEFKEEAVRLVREEGLSFNRVGDDLDVCISVLRDWRRKAERGRLGSPKPDGGRPKRSLEEENAALRKEVRILREEREILKGATAFFAREIR